MDAKPLCWQCQSGNAMKAAKILLFGQNGQVGWELQRALAPLGELVGADSRSTHLCGNLANLDGIARTIGQLQPDIIVNAAAHTAVDKAESEQPLAHLLNALAPGLLATEAAKCGALLVHYSTDYVFDGSGTKPWLENDTTAPLSVYGQTKRDGELRIQASGCRHLIFRTSWVYAARGGNFARTMLRLIQEREQLQVIDDQFGAPTGADLIADTTAQILGQLAWRKSDKADERLGIYHLAARGETTWNGYAKQVLVQALSAQAAIKIIAKEIKPVASSAFPTAARRPLNSRLDTTRLQETFGLRMPEWQSGVNRLLTEILV